MDKIEKPRVSWHCLIPFSRTRQVYKRDLDRYEQQFLDPIGKIRFRETKAINDTSALIISILTLFLTIVPWFAFALPKELEFLKLGLAPADTYSWADHFMAFAAPATGGTIIHKVPQLIPGKVGKIINLGLKLLPIIILIVYLIRREIEVHKIKQVNKNDFKNEWVSDNPQISEPNE